MVIRFMIFPFRILVPFMSSPAKLGLMRLRCNRRRRLVWFRGDGRIHYPLHVSSVDRVDPFYLGQRVGSDCSPGACGARAAIWQPVSADEIRTE